MHERDEQDFLAMVGRSHEKVAPGFFVEYEIRLGMFHRACNSGPLGSAMMISLIREFGILPNVVTKSNAPISASTLRKGQLVVWQEKVYAFNHIVSPGRIAVDSDDGRIEMPLKEVTLSVVASAKPGQAASGIDWSKVAVGTELVTGEDGLFGTFVRCGKTADVVVVDIDGKEHDCPAVEAKISKRV